MSGILNREARVKRFEEIVSEAQQETGLQIKAILQLEQLGEALLTRAALIIVEISDWEANTDEEKEK